MVTTRPMVEWSVITFCVPISAAWVKGIIWSNHGVFTIRSPFSSMCPAAPSTMKPTQSMRRTFTSTPSSRAMGAASLGTNLGSVVMTVLPAALWGSSSRVRIRTFSSCIPGKTKRSMKRLMNVDFPVRTGPTTPM